MKIKSFFKKILLLIVVAHITILTFYVGSYLLLDNHPENYLAGIPVAILWLIVYSLLGLTFLLKLLEKHIFKNES